MTELERLIQSLSQSVVAFFGSPLTSEESHKIMGMIQAERERHPGFIPHNCLRALHDRIMKEIDTPERLAYAEGLKVA
jgi:hypothetical protein